MSKYQIKILNGLHLTKRDKQIFAQMQEKQISCYKSRNKVFLLYPDNQFNNATIKTQNFSIVLNQLETIAHHYKLEFKEITK